MSRQVVVSDSSVLVDLERGGLFAAAFSLQLKYCVPDLLYQRELRLFCCYAAFFTLKSAACVLGCVCESV